MLTRLAFLGLVGVLSVTTLMTGSLTARPAEAQAQIVSITFAEGVNERGEPVGQTGIEFPGDNNGVWVIVRYRGLPQGARITRIVRFNGDDYNWDESPYPRLNCCPNGGDGTLSFPVVRLTGSQGDLPGGRYDVFLYLGDQEIGQAGFGVRGAGGAGRHIPGGNNNGNGGNGNG